MALLPTPLPPTSLLRSYKCLLPVAIAVQFLGQQSLMKIIDYVVFQSNQFAGAVVLLLWSGFLFTVCWRGRREAIKIKRPSLKASYTLLIAANSLAVCFYTLCVLLTSSPTNSN